MNVPWIAAAAVSPQMKELLSRMYALIVNENQRTQLIRDYRGTAFVESRARASEPRDRGSAARTFLKLSRLFAEQSYPRH
jgi:hypothetical protein